MHALDVDRRIERGERLVLHGCLDVTPFPIQAIELRGQALRGCRVVGHEAGDADRHVREPAGGIDTRACDKAKVVGRCASRIAAARGEQRGYPRLHASGTDASQALLDQDAIDAIEPDDVGDGAQRHEIEQRGKVRLGAVHEPPEAAQRGAQGDQQIEHDADPSQMLAGIVAPWLIRVHDPCGVRQPIAGQMMVGDQHVDAPSTRGGNALDAGDAVVDGDDQGRLPLRREGDNFRRQAVAEFEPVWHQEVDQATHRRQPAHADRACSCAVRVVVGDDQHPLTAHDGIGQACGRAVDALQGSPRRKARKAAIELRGGTNAARRIDARENFGYASRA